MKSERTWIGVTLTLACFLPAVLAETPRQTKAKMQKMVIPKVEFREASLEDVLEFLVQTSQEMDPKGVGVNIILVKDPKAKKPGKDTSKTKKKQDDFNWDFE